jgi:hypothetical protein
MTHAPPANTHPELHRLLAYAHQLRADHEKRLASYHWQKHIDPISPIPIPDEPIALHLFYTGDYHGFCRSLDLSCLPACPLCAEGEGQSENQSGS